MNNFCNSILILVKGKGRKSNVTRGKIFFIFRITRHRSFFLLNLGLFKCKYRYVTKAARDLSV
jgi:hypothetical protein